MTAKPRLKLDRDALRVPIDLKKLGPKMAALPNDMWRAAAVARFHVKGGNRGKNTAACRVAGFAGATPASMRVIAHRVFHDQRMLEALHELGEQFLKQGAPDAISAVFEILDNPRHPHRLKAAQVVMNYAHPVQTAHHVTVEHVDDRRMVDFARKLATELGVEADKLVGRIDGKLIEHEP